MYAAQNMIGILFTILIAVIVVGLVYWIVSMLPLPAVPKQIAMVVCALILLIWILNIIGFVGPTWRIHVG